MASRKALFAAARATTLCAAPSSRAGCGFDPAVLWAAPAASAMSIEPAGASLLVLDARATALSCDLQEVADQLERWEPWLGHSDPGASEASLARSARAAEEQGRWFASAGASPGCAKKAIDAQTRGFAMGAFDEMLARLEADSVVLAQIVEAEAAYRKETWAYAARLLRLACESPALPRVLDAGARDQLERKRLAAIARARLQRRSGLVAYRALVFGEVQEPLVQLPHAVRAGDHVPLVFPFFVPARQQSAHHFAVIKGNRGRPVSGASLVVEGASGCSKELG